MHGSTSPPKNGLLGPRRDERGAVAPGDVLANEADGLACLLALGIEPEPAQELEDVERVRPVVIPRLAGPQAVRRLEREQLRAPALGRDLRPLGGDHVRRLVESGRASPASGLPDRSRAASQ